MPPLANVSRPARIATGLGLLALVPFLVGALAIWLVDPPLRAGASLALAAYAAVVVSFIGAIHWGLGFRQPQPATSLFVWGVVPSIVGWIAVLAPSRPGLVLQALMLAVCYLVDRHVYVREQVATWLPLRRNLTVPAALCCLFGAFGN